MKAGVQVCGVQGELLSRQLEVSTQKLALGPRRQASQEALAGGTGTCADAGARNGGLAGIQESLVVCEQSGGARWAFKW